MIVSDLMVTPVFAVRPGESVQACRNLMLRHKISRLLVMSENKLQGIITRRDIGFLHDKKGPVWKRRVDDNVLVSSVMVGDPVCISPDTGIRDVMIMMDRHKVSGFPVTDLGRVLGIITKSDLMKSPMVENCKLKFSSLIEPVPIITSKHSPAKAIELIREKPGKVVIADDNGYPIGIISESDLAFYEGGDGKADSLCAGSMMKSPVITIGSDGDVKEVIDLIRQKRITSVVIVDGNEIKGIITRDHIIQEVIA